MLYDGQPLPHFNEVDECAGLDGLMTYRVHQGAWASRSRTRCTTFAGATGPLGNGDRLRLGVCDQRLGAAGAFHRRLGAASAASGSRRCISVSAAGRSRASASPARSSGRRIFVEDGRLKMDLGRAQSSNCRRRKPSAAGSATTPQWPIMHAVTYGVSRDQMMARHKSNHIQVAYARRRGSRHGPAGQGGHGPGPGAGSSLCGTPKDGKSW